MPERALGWNVAEIETGWLWRCDTLAQVPNRWCIEQEMPPGDLGPCPNHPRRQALRVCCECDEKMHVPFFFFLTHYQTALARNQDGRPRGCAKLDSDSEGRAIGDGGIQLPSRRTRATGFVSLLSRTTCEIDRTGGRGCNVVPCVKGPLECGRRLWLFVPSVSCALAAVSFHLYSNVVGCNMRAPGRQKPVSKCRPVGGRSLASPPRPTASRSRDNECLEPRVCCPTSRVGRAASLRPVGHAKMPTRRRRRTANEKPLTVLSKSIRCFLSLLPTANS